MIDAGHTVRGTTRDPERTPELKAAGIEPHVGDPDRIATIFPALEHVSVACILLGSAGGDPQSLASLHGSRLEMLLHKLLDTTVRGVVYEAAGSVPAAVLARGRSLVAAVAEDSRIPSAAIEADPVDADRWLQGALAAARDVLE